MESDAFLSGSVFLFEIGLLASESTQEEKLSVVEAFLKYSSLSYVQFLIMWEKSHLWDKSCPRPSCKCIKPEMGWLHCRIWRQNPGCAHHPAWHRALVHWGSGPVGLHLYHSEGGISRQTREWQKWLYNPNLLCHCTRVCTQSLLSFHSPLLFISL